MVKSAIFTLMLAVILLYSCQDRSFVGTANVSKGEKATDGKSKKDGTLTPEDPTSQPEPADDGQGNKPDDTNDGGKTTGGGKISWPSIIDMIGGLLQTLNNVEITGGDTEIIFGGDKAFHIGDNAMDQSTCLDELVVYPVRGIKYYFEFQVLENATDLDISVDTLCGIDYNDSNFAYILGNSTPFQTIKLSAGQTSAKFNRVVLNPGTYAVMVESQRNTTEHPTGDNDDYIAGGIHIKSVSGKKIQAGQVRFE